MCVERKKNFSLREEIPLFILTENEFKKFILIFGKMDELEGP